MNFIKWDFRCLTKCISILRQSIFSDSNGTLFFCAVLILICDPIPPKEIKISLCKYKNINLAYLFFIISNKQYLWVNPTYGLIWHSLIKNDNHLKLVSQTKYYGTPCIAMFCQAKHHSFSDIKYAKWVEGWKRLWLFKGIQNYTFVKHCFASMI